MTDDLKEKVIDRLMGTVLVMTSALVDDTPKITLQRYTEILKEIVLIIRMIREEKP